MFKFRLQALLDYRKRREDILQKELALKNKKLMNETDILNGYNRDKEDRAKKLSSLSQERGDITAYEIGTYYNYFERISGMALAQKGNIAKAAKECEDKRVELVKSVTNRKIIEILKGKEYKRYADNLKQIEAKLIDEIVITRHKKPG